VPSFFTNDAAINDAGAVTGAPGALEWQANRVTLTAGWAITDIKWYGIRAGTISDNLICEIYASSGGYPTGSALATASVAGSTFSTSDTWNSMGITYAVPSTNPYVIVFSRSGTRDAVNVVTIRGGTTSTYSGGIWVYRSSSVWNTYSGDLSLEVIYTADVSAPLDVFSPMPMIRDAKGRSF
jgi:hypothetical protein